MKAVRVMITCFLYKWQDTVQIHRQGPTLPCSDPNLTSQINQTKSEERSTNPEKSKACSHFPHTGLGLFLQQLLFKSTLVDKTHNITVLGCLKITTQALKIRRSFLPKIVNIDSPYLSRFSSRSSFFSAATRTENVSLIDKKPKFSKNKLKYLGT